MADPAPLRPPAAAAATPTLGDAVEEFEEKQQDFQAMYNAGGHFKEQLEAIAGGGKTKEAPVVKSKEITTVEEVPVHPEVAPELGGYIEKVEKEPELNQALADEYVQQVGMTTPAPQSPHVKLPLTSSQIQQGLHRKVWEAIRWLAVWCLRQMKMISLRRA